MASVDRMLASALRHIYMEEKWNPVQQQVSTYESSSSHIEPEQEEMHTSHESTDDPMLFGGNAVTVPTMNYALLGTSVLGMVGTLGAICI